MSRIEIAKEDWGKPDALRKAFDRSRSGDAMMLERALGILHRMATENTGWRSFFRRWYYSDEPLRNDAANIVRLAQFAIPMADGTRLVGDGRGDQ